MPDSTATRHPIYYYPLGTFVFRPDKSNIIFKIHGDALARKSVGFAAMLGFQVDGNDCTEQHQSISSLAILDGSNDENPIWLPDTTAFEFERLLHCIYSGWQYPPNLDDMAAVLKLSDRWICAEPKAFAVAEINRLNLTPFYGSVNPCRLLELSCLYRVDEWFRPAFEQPVSTPVHTLSLDNIRALGDRNYTALSRCQSTIQQLRLSISATPPPIIYHTTSCTSTPSCESAWKAFWWNVFAKDYLLGPLSESEALEFVKNATPNHVTPECKARVVENIWDRDIFCAEYRVTQSAVEVLMRLQKDT